MKIVYHPKYLEHEQWSGHPECPERLTGIVGKLTELGLFNNVIEPEPQATPCLLLDVLFLAIADQATRTG